jgi:hypothetical protein
MLVIGAQPVGTAELDLDEEERQIRFRFQRLVDDGMMEVDVIAQATPQSPRKAGERGAGGGRTTSSTSWARRVRPRASQES